MATVFVYGTLINADTRKRALGRVPPMTADSIPGYRDDSFYTPEGKHFHTVTPVGEHTGHYVHGDTFEVSTAELNKLDRYEDEYRRLVVTLKSGKTAYVYVLRDKFKIKKENN